MKLISNSFYQFVFILHCESKSIVIADAFYVPWYAILSSTPNDFHVVRSKAFFSVFFIFQFMFLYQCLSKSFDNLFYFY